MTDRKHMRAGSIGWSMLGQFKNMSPEERAVFLEEVVKTDEVIRAQQKHPWPRVVKLYAHQTKQSGWHAGQRIGLDMEEIGRWCPLSQVEITAEVQEDGEVNFLACDGYMIDYDRPYEGPLYEPEKD